MKEKLPSLNSNAIENFEKWMDEANENVPQLRNFMLPGGHSSVADAHVARSVCRRAERRVVALSRVDSIDSEIVKYLNRLSDLLFTTARLLSHISNTDEIEWNVAND